MKIAIINQPVANRGDESAHKAFVRQLHRALPNVQIDVIFIGREKSLVDAMRVDEKNIDYINLPKIKLEGTIEKFSILFNLFSLSYFHPTLRKFQVVLDSYDKIICAPGGICMGGFLSWDHIWQLMVAKELRKPVYYWGRSIGPFSDTDFSHSVFKKRSLELLQYFSYVSLRDKRSIEIARDMGIEVCGVVDSAFLETPDVDIPLSVSDLLGEDYIVFVPNQLTWHYRYRDVPQGKIDGFYISIFDVIKDKYPHSKIIMLPQTFNSKINDYDYFLKLKKAACKDEVIVLDEKYSSDIQQCIIKKARLVIGVRYHSIVFALNNGVPFISLSYEHKMKGLLETIGGAQNMVDIENIFDGYQDEHILQSIEQIRVLLSSISVPFSVDRERKLMKEEFDELISKLAE